MRGPAAAPHQNSPHRMPRLFGYRQGDDDDGSAFNQPLNFDTSRVTNMDEMFEVHTAARALLCLRLQSSLRLRVTHARPAPSETFPSYPPPRQAATAFNQPVNFDTSRVKIMGEMFRVHSARAPCPALRLQPSLLVHAGMRGRRPTPTYSPFLARQGAKAFNQPLSFDTSLVTNFEVMFEVPCA